MQFWLFKSEPYKFSWDQQCEKGEGRWEKRVRNFQARNNMQAMKVGDKAFFYHSNEGKEIVGTLEITRESYPDPDDDTGKFVTVNVKPLKPLQKPVNLQTLKAHDLLQNMKVVKQVRLSVSPVTPEEWKTVCKLGGI